MSKTFKQNISSHRIQNILSNNKTQSNESNLNQKQNQTQQVLEWFVDKGIQQADTQKIIDQWKNQQRKVIFQNIRKQKVLTQQTHENLIKNIPQKRLKKILTIKTNNQI